MDWWVGELSRDQRSRSENGFYGSPLNVYRKQYLVSWGILDRVFCILRGFYESVIVMKSVMLTLAMSFLCDPIFFSKQRRQIWIYINASRSSTITQSFKTPILDILPENRVRNFRGSRSKDRAQDCRTKGTIVILMSQSVRSNRVFWGSRPYKKVSPFAREVSAVP